MSIRSCSIRAGFLATLVLGIPTALFAQGPFPDAPTTPSIEPVVATPSVVSSTPNFEVPHRFFDKQNLALFSAVAATSAADFAVTRSNLQNGGQEMNPMVRIFGRSTAGLAMNFVGEAAGSMGLSFFFHKTGHHKLERAVSYVNIGGSLGAVSYGLAHR